MHAVLILQEPRPLCDTLSSMSPGSGAIRQSQVAVRPAADQVAIPDVDFPLPSTTRAVDCAGGEGRADPGEGLESTPGHDCTDSARQTAGSRPLRAIPGLAVCPPGDFANAYGMAMPNMKNRTIHQASALMSTPNNTPPLAGESGTPQERTIADNPMPPKRSPRTRTHAGANESIFPPLSLTLLLGLGAHEQSAAHQSFLVHRGVGHAQRLH